MTESRDGIAESVGPAPGSADQQKVNILLVDDDPANLAGLQAVLEPLGQNLVPARSGKEALRCLLRDDFALILLDVHMPGLDGMETAALIRERDRTRDVPIIFLTGYERTDVQMFRGYSLGAVDYLTKPVVPQVLRSKVSVFVELYQKTEQVRRQAEQLRAGDRREHERQLREEKQRWEMERLREEAAREKKLAEELSRTVAERARAEEKVREQARQLGQLKDELAARLADMTRLQQLSARLSRTLELPAVRREVLAALAELHQAGMGVLFSFSPERGELSAAASVGLPPECAEALAKIPAGAGVCGAVLARRGAVVVEDVEAGAAYAAEVPAARRAGYRAACALPLLTRGGAVIGAVAVYFARPHRPTDRDLRLAELYARQAAEALDNARLHGEIREANRGKDEFLAMLAHELRNPLAPVLHSLHVLRLCDDPAAAAAARDMVERQVRHMSRLIDDLLDVSRITRGKIRLRQGPVELADVVRQAVEGVRPLLESRSHRLEVVMPGEPVRLLADGTRLEQVLANLLNNAAKYTEPGGTIWLTARREGGAVVLSVRDTGMGIPPAMLPRVFDLFMQAHATLDRSQGGLGIGLTLVKSLVEMHGGRVEALSAGPGKGSEFVVRLPVTDPPPEPAESDAPKAPVARRPLRVLIVDDNRDAVESLALLLRLDGHEVHTAHDGPSALEAAEAQRPEVVLLDIGLPGMSGYEVAERLLGGGPPADFLLVAMTGYGQDEDRRRSKEAGFAHHLVKPVDPEVLRELLARP